MAVQRCVLLWAAGSVLGGGLIAWPDDGDRVFSVSGDHGPGALDTLGSVVVVGCWLPVLVLIATRLRWRSDRAAQVGAGVAVAAAVLLAVTIRLDLGASWVLPVVALVAVQGAALRRIWTTSG